MDTVNEMKNVLALYFGMRVTQKEDFSWIDIRWIDGENEDRFTAAMRPWMVRENRAALVIALVRGALKMREWEEMNDEVQFKDLLKLMSGSYSAEERQDLKEKVFEGYSCLKRFEEPELYED